MPTHKDRTNFRRLSISQLVALTGKAPKTVANRLREAGTKTVAEDGKTLYFDAHAALPVIYQAEDQHAERARLDRVRADMVEHRLAIERGEFIRIADCEHAIATVLTGLTSQLLALPAALAEELASCSEPAEVARILNEALRGALKTVANAETSIPAAARNRTQRAPADRDGAGSAAPAAGADL